MCGWYQNIINQVYLTLQAQARFWYHINPTFWISLGRGIEMSGTLCLNKSLMLSSLISSKFKSSLFKDYELHC